MDQIKQAQINLFMRCLKKLPQGIKALHTYADVEALMAVVGYPQLAVGTKKNHYDRVKGF